MATRDALWEYRDRFGEAFGRTYFRRFGPGVAASVGVGTYLGAPPTLSTTRIGESSSSRSRTG
jgi:hypothetical protein